jgi:HEAT repeat protein
MRWAVALLLAALAPSPALAQDAAAVRAMLGGVEDAPSAAEWEALGPGAVAVLAQLFDDRREAPIVRTRAVWAARFYPTAESRDFLERVVRAEGGLVRRTAAESLAAAFGASAVPTLVPLLEDADPAVREGVIRALGRLGGDAAAAALRSHRAAERDADLRDLLDRTLAALR